MSSTDLSGVEASSHTDEAVCRRAAWSDCRPKGIPGCRRIGMSMSTLGLPRIGGVGAYLSFCRFRSWTGWSGAGRTGCQYRPGPRAPQSAKSTLEIPLSPTHARPVCRYVLAFVHRDHESPPFPSCARPDGVPAFERHPGTRSRLPGRSSESVPARAGRRTLLSSDDSGSEAATRGHGSVTARAPGLPSDKLQTDEDPSSGSSGVWRSGRTAILIGRGHRQTGAPLTECRCPERLSPADVLCSTPAYRRSAQDQHAEGRPHMEHAPHPSGGRRAEAWSTTRPRATGAILTVPLLPTTSCPQAPVTPDHREPNGLTVPEPVPWPHRRRQR